MIANKNGSAKSLFCSIHQANISKIQAKGIIQKNVENNWFKSNFYWVENNIYNKVSYENLWN